MHRLASLPVETETTTTAFRYLVNAYGERYLHAINGQTFARCPAATVYQTHFSFDLFAENALYVFVGTDGGLLPAYLRSRELPSGTRYVFIELEEILTLLEVPGTASDTSSSLIFCTGADWRKVLDEHQLPEYAYRNAVILIPSLGVTDNYYTGYRELWRTIDANLRQVLWEYGVQLSSKVYVRRQLENLAENLIPAAKLRNIGQNHTAAVLAGGPSLTQFLPWVLANRDKLIVISVSRISRLLQAAGISPDIVVSVDPNPISFDVSKEMLDFDQTLLVNGYHITPLLLGNYRGRSVYTDSAIPWQTPEDNIRSVGPTVTNTALQLAQDLGCKQILLLGVDLCYSPEGYSHALGSLEHAAGPLVGYVGQTVTTNSGNTAETDPPFLHATKALALQAQRAAFLQCQMINPGPNAAAIPGIEFRRIEDIRLTPIDRPLREVIAQALPELSVSERKALYQARFEECQRALDELEQIRRLCRKALAFNTRLHHKRNPRMKYKLDQIELKLNDPALLGCSRLCKVFASERFARVLATTDTRTWTDEFIERNAREYYEAYLHGADAFGQAVAEARDRLVARMEELEDNPPWERLAERWIKDRQCGRLLIRQRLMKGRPQVTPPSPEMREELLRNYRKELESTDSRHMKTCLQRARLSGVIGKANEHLENQDDKALLRLIHGLKLRTEAEAIPLTALCQGYLAELHSDLDAAIDAYGQVSAGPAVEYALIRLTGIAIAREDYNHALLALEHLMQCSMAYAPQFAEMLKLTGDPSRAIDVYTEYLSLAPNDLIAMTRLGLLYQELNITEGVEWINQYVATQTQASRPK